MRALSSSPMDKPDPLSAEARALELARARPKRGLPIAPDAKPGARNLPLAAEARDVDRRHRPIYAVWEITLACDLACRHCGSRAGHGSPRRADDRRSARPRRPDGRPRRQGGHAHRRRGVPARRLARHRPARSAARGMICTTTSGGRGLTPEIVAEAKAAGLHGGEHLDRRRRGDPRSPARRRRLVPLGDRGDARAPRAGLRVSCNTQINRLSMPHPRRASSRRSRPSGIKAWQIQLTVPMGRAADEPDILLQPYDLLELFPLLADAQEALRRARRAPLAGQQHRLLRPVRVASCAATTTAATAARAARGARRSASRPTAPSRGARRCRPTPWTGGNIRDASLKDIWERSEPLRYTRDRTTRDLWGYCQTCYYAEECMSGCTWTSFVTLGKPGNNPYCHHRAIEMARAGKRERVVRVTPAPGEPFDHGIFEIVVEDTPSPSTRALSPALETSHDQVPPSSLPRAAPATFA